MKAGRHLPETWGSWALVWAVAVVFTATILVVTQGSPSAERDGRYSLVLIWVVLAILFLDWLLFRRRWK